MVSQYTITRIQGCIFAIWHKSANAYYGTCIQFSVSINTKFILYSVHSRSSWLLFVPSYDNTVGVFPHGTTSCRTCQRQLTVSCVNCLRRAAEDSGADGDDGEDSRGEHGGDEARTTLWKLILEASAKEKATPSKVRCFPLFSQSVSFSICLSLSFSPPRPSEWQMKFILLNSFFVSSVCCDRISVIMIWTEAESTIGNSYW